jgi:homoserine kinase
MSDSGVPRAERIDVRADLAPVVCVPTAELATSTARKMLPGTVPHRDAAFNAGRSALLVHALARRPDLLLEATHDRLHQAQRAAAMPATAQLIDLIRQHGGAAVVSGAGPSVLVLGTESPGARGPVGSPPVADTPSGRPGMDPVDAAFRQLQELAGPAGATPWTVLRPGVDTVGALLATDGD